MSIVRQAFFLVTKPRLRNEITREAMLLSLFLLSFPSRKASEPLTKTYLIFLKIGLDIFSGSE